MKRIFVLFLIICFAAGSLLARKQYNVQKTETDSCIFVTVDSFKTTHHFPMIMVGKAKSYPDSVEIHLLSSAKDSLSGDTLEKIFDDKKELIDFFVRNIVYPNKLKENNSEDNLRLLMQLNKDGELVKSKVINSRIPEMEKEVLRVTKLLPRLTTTNNKGERVDISVELPISFRMLRL